MKYFIYQTENNGCGLACAKMLLGYYHRNKRYLFDEHEKISSLLDIKRYLDKRGLKTTGVKVERKYFNKDFNNSIAHIIEGENKHFVVLKKIGKKYIKIYDPKRGLRIIKKESFFNIFDGILLIVEDVCKHTCSFIEKKNISYSIAYISSLVIDFSIVYFFTYIINTKNLFLVLLLSLIALINFAFKLLIVFGFNSYLDKKIIEPYINSLDLSQLELFVKYKSELLQNKFKKISYLLISIFGMVLLTINSIFNLVILLEIIIFIILKKWVIKIYLLLKKEDGYHIQRNYLSDRKNNYVLLNKISNRYAFMSIFYYILIIIVLFITIVIIGKIDNKFSLSYILFSVMSALTIYELINRYLYLLEDGKDNLNLLKNKVYGIKNKTKNEVGL